MRREEVDDLSQCTSATPMNTKETIPLIKKPQRKWYFFRSVHKYFKITHTIDSYDSIYNYFQLLFMNKVMCGVCVCVCVQVACPLHNMFDYIVA